MPAAYLVVEGLLNFHAETLRSAHDVRVFLARPWDSGAAGSSSMAETLLAKLELIEAREQGDVAIVTKLRAPAAAR